MSMPSDSHAGSDSPNQGFCDRSLLYAIMALRVGFIRPEQLIATLHAWVDSKLEAMENVLVRLGFLAQSQCALLTPIVDEFIKRHGGDARSGLTELSPLGDLHQQIKVIDDSGLQNSLATIREPDHHRDPEPTRSWTGNEERFRILNFHRQGGLGKVSVAFDNELGREVAFKEIRDEYINVRSMRERFLLEAEITGRLEHPGIVPVYGLGHYSDGRPFYAMRFVRGDSLKSAIRLFHTKEFASQSQRRLEFRKLIERFLDVCEAVEYAHSRGVLHRDLKPGNIMLGRYGETLVVDWGLAKSVARVHKEMEPKEDTLRPRGAIGSSGNSHVTAECLWGDWLCTRARCHSSQLEAFQHTP